MSAFDNNEKDEVVEVVSVFLENHKISELMDIIRYCIEEYEYNKEN